MYAGCDRLRRPSCARKDLWGRLGLGMRRKLRRTFFCSEGCKHSVSKMVEKMVAKRSGNDITSGCVYINNDVIPMLAQVFHESRTQLSSFDRQAVVGWLDWRKQSVNDRWTRVDIKALDLRNKHFICCYRATISLVVQEMLCLHVFSHYSFSIETSTKMLAISLRKYHKGFSVFV